MISSTSVNLSRLAEHAQGGSNDPSDALDVIDGKNANRTFGAAHRPAWIHSSLSAAQMFSENGKTPALCWQATQKAGHELLREETCSTAARGTNGLGSMGRAKHRCGGRSGHVRQPPLVFHTDLRWRVKWVGASNGPQRGGCQAISGAGRSLDPWVMHLEISAKGPLLTIAHSWLHSQPSSLQHFRPFRFGPDIVLESQETRGLTLNLMALAEDDFLEVELFDSDSDITGIFIGRATKSEGKTVTSRMEELRQRSQSRAHLPLLAQRLSHVQIARCMITCIKSSFVSLRDADGN